MADYYPLIARAVAGLEKNTGENRRALYERARTALVAQLRGVTPALDESEITRERLALEEAIRRIEAEAARQAREASRPPPPPRPAPPPPRESLPPREASPRRELPQRPAQAPLPPRPSETPIPRRPSPSTSLSDEAMKGFRDVVSDPNAVAASHQAAPPPRRERPLFTPPAAPPPASAPSPSPQDGQERGPDLRHPSPTASAEPPWTPPPASEAPAPEPVDFDEVRAANGRARLQRGSQDDEPEVLSQPVPLPPVSVRSYSGVIRTAAILALIGMVAAVAFWQRGNIGSAAGSLMALFTGPATPVRDPGTAAPTRPKITDRLGQPGTGQQPEAAVAQRVVLYEEDPDEPQGKRLVGSAVWRTEMLPAAPGRAAEMAVRADVEIPERRMTMTWSLRRNTDPALPASHTIEIMFNMPQDATGGGVQNVPGVLMKQAEQTRGVPLAGLAVKVTPGFFLIGLSSLETDVQRNLGLLKERSWLDIPIVYNNNRRAILALEKGNPGERAFAEAFAAWKQ